MFGQRKRLRHMAAFMVLVWLFALSTGIANACGGEPDLRHEALAGAQRHHGVAQAHHHGQAPSHVDKSPCAKFCDAESASMPTVKPQADPGAAVWLAPLPALSPVVQAALEPVGAWLAEHGAMHARVPIPIAFLRLTL